MLREYFAFPQRYLFFGLTGLGAALKKCTGQQLDVIILLNAVDTRLEGRINASCFELFCTPAINLFSKHLDRIPLSNRFSEFQVVADRNRIPVVTRATLTPDTGHAFVGANIRLGETGDVRAIVEQSDGTLLQVTREVKVTVGGCGG